MSEANQSRSEQYRPIKANKPPQRRAPKLSPGQPVSSSQSSNRGKQGNG
jgi:hypothetical protein